MLTIISPTSDPVFVVGMWWFSISQYRNGEWSDQPWRRHLFMRSPRLNNFCLSSVKQGWNSIIYWALSSSIPLYRHPYGRSRKLQGCTTLRYLNNPYAVTLRILNKDRGWTSIEKCSDAKHLNNRSIHFNLCIRVGFLVQFTFHAIGLF
jgi:hypothetical protein